MENKKALGHVLAIFTIFIWAHVSFLQKSCFRHFSQ